MRTRVALTNSSWLAFALNPFPDLFAIGPGGTAASTAKLKVKDALLRRRHTDRQIAVLYHHLTRDDVSVGGAIGLATYGGRVNAVSPDATAASQRAAVLDTAYTTGWQDANDEESQHRVAARILSRRIRRDGWSSRAGRVVRRSAHQPS